MPDLRDKRRVGTPQQRGFTPVQPDDSVARALQGLGGDITTAATGAAKLVGARTQRKDSTDATLAGQDHRTAANLKLEELKSTMSGAPAEDVTKAYMDWVGTDRDRVRTAYNLSEQGFQGFLSETNGDFNSHIRGIATGFSALRREAERGSLKTDLVSRGKSFAATSTFEDLRQSLQDYETSLGNKVENPLLAHLFAADGDSQAQRLEQGNVYLGEQFFRAKMRANPEAAEEDLAANADTYSDMFGETFVDKMLAIVRQEGRAQDAVTEERYGEFSDESLQFWSAEISSNSFTDEQDIRAHPNFRNLRNAEQRTVLGYFKAKQKEDAAIVRAKKAAGVPKIGDSPGYNATYVDVVTNPGQWNTARLAEEVAEGNLNTREMEALDLDLKTKVSQMNAKPGVSEAVTRIKTLELTEKNKGGILTGQQVIQQQEGLKQWVLENPARPVSDYTGVVFKDLESKQAKRAVELQGISNPVEDIVIRENAVDFLSTNFGIATPTEKDIVNYDVANERAGGYLASRGKDPGDNANRDETMLLFIEADQEIAEFNKEAAEFNATVPDSKKVALEPRTIETVWARVDEKTGNVKIKEIEGPGILTRARRAVGRFIGGEQ